MKEGPILAIWRPTSEQWFEIREIHLDLDLWITEYGFRSANLDDYPSHKLGAIVKLDVPFENNNVKHWDSIIVAIKSSKFGPPGEGRNPFTGEEAVHPDAFNPPLKKQYSRIQAILEEKYQCSK